MEWQNSLNTGITSVDSQHKELVNILNRLQESMSVGESQKQIGATIIALVEYTKYHFADEEKVMVTIGYPHLDAHKKLHNALISDIRDILIRIKQGKSIIATEILRFLQDWVVNHIRNEDLKIGKFLLQKKVKQTNLLGDTGAEITAKLQKLAMLFQQKIISEEEHHLKKVEILADKLGDEIAQNPSDIQNAFKFLKNICTENLINQEENEECKRELFEKCDLSNLLEKISEFDEKLQFLKWCGEEKMLSSEDHKKYKDDLLNNI